MGSVNILPASSAGLASSVFFLPLLGIKSKRTNAYGQGFRMEVGEGEEERKKGDANEQALTLSKECLKAQRHPRQSSDSASYPPRDTKGR